MSRTCPGPHGVILSPAFPQVSYGLQGFFDKRGRYEFDVIISSENAKPVTGTYRFQFDPNVNPNVFESSLTELSFEPSRNPMTAASDGLTMRGEGQVFAPAPAGCTKERAAATDEKN